MTREQSEQRPVSIIMRTKNSDWVIAQALAGLFSQTHTNFELIIVDCKSTDKTLDIVNQYPHRLISIEPSTYFPGPVLNRAIEAATNDVVVFQNSDVVPLTPHALERLVQPFDEPEVAATYARQACRPEADAWVRRDYDASFPDSPDSPPWISISLPFAALRKSVWAEHPFYDAAWASEDTEWGEWARNNGHEIRYVHDSLVMHSHNYTLRQLHGRRYVEGEADAFIYGGSESLFGVLQRTIKSTGKDLWRQLCDGTLHEAPSTPLRRLVYHWAYYQGHRMGEERREEGNADAAAGQAFILARHDK